MKINLKKIIYDESLLKELKFFKQFNIYKTIDCREYTYIKKIFKNKLYLFKENLKFFKAEVTSPIIDIKFANIINTIEGTSLEGQHLSGKKLIVIGEIKFILILFYSNYKEHKYKIINIIMPFSTFIIVPKDICKSNVVNLRYIIEDISLVYLEEDKIMISVTPLIQYLDKYFNDNIF